MSRPTVPILSVDIITDASIRLLETTGTFTIPKLAKSLGVTPSSLYNHVSGREEIIELMRGELLERFPVEGDETIGRDDWEGLVLGTVRALRRTYAAVPALVPLLFWQTVSHPAVVASYDRLATRFSKAGFADDELIPLISMLDSFAYGAALDIKAPSEVWRFSEIPGNEDSNPSPLQRALAANDAETRAERSFEYGCQLLIAGLRQRMPR
ncbi:TetR/AcrR family transcriptional regulator [Leifsonia sp. A12D58]|uniref:TetR/AcrR family transcriptional regulator n=1 Tax=Leifsonia sp. A12D58 TaxID=3397674 RepID=UPI0039DF321B